MGVTIYTLAIAALLAACHLIAAESLAPALLDVLAEWFNANGR